MILFYVIPRILKFIKKGECWWSWVGRTGVLIIFNGESSRNTKFLEIINGSKDCRTMCVHLTPLNLFTNG